MALDDWVVECLMPDAAIVRTEIEPRNFNEALRQGVPKAF